MTPPLHSLRNIHDIESYTLNTPYDSSIDTVSCCTREFPPTPTTTCTQLMQSIKHRRNSSHSSTSSHDPNNDAYHCINPLVQQHNHHRAHHWSSALTSTTTTATTTDSALLLQRGPKSDAAQVFVMTQPVELGLVLESDKSAWWLLNSSKEQHEECNIDRSNWWSKMCDYLFERKKSLPETVITVECFSKHECETAGKLHQVLEECYNGKLSGRMYPHGKIVWSGTMNTPNQKSLFFLCHMTIQQESRIRVNFVLRQGKQGLLKHVLNTFFLKKKEKLTIET